MNTLPSSHTVDPLNRPAKEVTRDLLDHLPDDCTLEQVRDNLDMLSIIKERAALDREDRYISHEDIKRQFKNKWPNDQ